LDKKQIPVIVLLCVVLILNIVLIGKVETARDEISALKDSLNYYHNDTDAYLDNLYYAICDVREQVEYANTDLEDVEVEYLGLTSDGKVKTQLSFSLKEYNGGKIIVSAKGDTLSLEAEAAGEGTVRSCVFDLPTDENYVLNVEEKSENGSVKLNGEAIECRVLDMMENRTRIMSTGIGSSGDGMNGDFDVRNATLGASELHIASAYIELYLDGEQIYRSEMKNRLSYNGLPVYDDAEPGVELMEYVFNAPASTTKAPAGTDFSKVKWQLVIEYYNGETFVMGDDIGEAAGKY